MTLRNYLVRAYWLAVELSTLVRVRILSVCVMERAPQLLGPTRTRSSVDFNILYRIFQPMMLCGPVCIAANGFGRG